MLLPSMTISFIGGPSSPRFAGHRFRKEEYTTFWRDYNLYQGIHPLRKKRGPGIPQPSF